MCNIKTLSKISIAQLFHRLFKIINGNLFDRKGKIPFGVGDCKSKGYLYSLFWFNIGMSDAFFPW